MRVLHMHKTGGRRVSSPHYALRGGGRQRGGGVAHNLLYVGYTCMRERRREREGERGRKEGGKTKGERENLPGPHGSNRKTSSKSAHSRCTCTPSSYSAIRGSDGTRKCLSSVHTKYALVITIALSLSIALSRTSKRFLPPMY